MKYQVANKEAQTVGFILSLLSGFAVIAAICLPWVKGDDNEKEVRLGLWKICSYTNKIVLLPRDFSVGVEARWTSGKFVHIRTKLSNALEIFQLK